MKTERLTIRPIEESDWQSIQKIWIDFNRSKYVIYDTYKNTDTEDVKKRIAKWEDTTRNGKEHIFMVSCLKDLVIGFISLNIRMDGYEIGYGFLDQYQGKGYAKESLLAIFDYMKEQGVKKYMPEQQKIISLLLDYLTVLVFNWLEQSGFRFIKTVKEMIFILKVEIL